MTPLNLSAKSFCNYIGITYNGDILKSLRELGLIKYFRVGKKYMYPTTEAEKISEMLLNNEISIKINNRYYITINRI